MRFTACMRTVLLGFLCCALMTGFMPDSARAEDRNFSFYAGKAGTLLESADAFVRRMHPDMKKTPQSDENISSDSASGGYTVVREVPDRMGKAGATRPEDVSVVGVSIQVFKARADHPGAGAEADALKRAREHFTFLLQEDGQRGIIKEQQVPDKGAQPGAYAYYRFEDGFDRGARALAGNIFISVHMNDSGFKLDRPDPKALIESILAGLSGAAPAAAGKVEVFPYAGLSPSNKGLIPASDRLPAKIVYSGAKPGDEVRFSIPADAPGELRGAGSAGKTVSVLADPAGQAAAQYVYRSPVLLVKPVKLEVQVSHAGQTLPAEITAGLGLAFDKLKTIYGQTYEKNTYAFSLTVKSRFHPDLNVALYLANTELAGVWPGVHMGLKLIAAWVNRPADAVFDEYYKGTANIVAGDENTSFLVANEAPWYSPPGAKFFYPAVVMKSEGRHAYRINGRGAVLSTDGTFVDYLNEKMVTNDTLLFLVKEDPEAWYQSLACSLNAATDTQYLMLEAVKLVPVYGAIADKATTVSGLVCSLLSEEYEKSLMDIANWVGAQYLDNLMEPAVFNKLSSRQQDAVLGAKALTTGGTDNYKRAQDVDELRSRK